MEYRKRGKLFPCGFQRLFLGRRRMSRLRVPSLILEDGRPAGRRREAARRTVVPHLVRSCEASVKARAAGSARGGGRRLAAAAALMAVLVAAVPGRAEPLVLDLPEVVRRARAESRLLRAAGFDVARAGEQVRKARAQRVLPEARLTLGGGLVPEATGSVTAGGDSGGLDTLGPYYRAELKLVQPLWSFGRIDALEEAANRGLAAERERQTLAAGNVALDAVRAYWALVAARGGEETAEQMRRDFDKLVGEVEARLMDQASGVDDADLFKVRTKSYGIELLHRGALEALDASLDAVRALLALAPTAVPREVGEPTPGLGWDDAESEAIVARAVEENGEVRALGEALRALAAKVELQKRGRRPQFFIAAGVGYAHAGNRDEQDNPWANDDFNYLRVGAELGLAWNANLYRVNIDVSEAESERQALAERLGALRTRVELEARRLLREVRRDTALFEAVRSSLRAARSRLRLVLDNWESGLGDVDRVLDAYEDYYELKAEEPRRHLALNVAIARLGGLFGDINRYLEWVRDGTVRF